QLFDPGAYNPKGMLAWLFGPTMPPLGFFHACEYLAWVSTVCVILGLFTRPCMLVSMLTTITLGSLMESFQPSGWSHSGNFIYLAQVAFLFAPAGSFVSVDRWLNARGVRTDFLPPHRPRQASFWPILLTSWVLALGFANAAFFKLHRDD